MTLYELATRLGVETHDPIHPSVPQYVIDNYHLMDLRQPRPANDIAHECLAKLPTSCEIVWDHGRTWHAKYNGNSLFDDDDNGEFTFPQAVLELGARFLQGQK